MNSIFPPPLMPSLRYLTPTEEVYDPDDLLKVVESSAKIPTDSSPRSTFSMDISDDEGSALSTDAIHRAIFRAMLQPDVITLATQHVQNELNYEHDLLSRGQKRRGSIKNPFVLKRNKSD